MHLFSNHHLYPQGVTNSGQISSNGLDGGNGYYAESAISQPMGGGGGGAGGVIWIRSGSSNTLTNTPVVGMGVEWELTENKTEFVGRPSAVTVGVSTH